MRLKARLQREWRFVRGLNRTLKRVKSISKESPNLLCDDLQAAMDKWRGRPAMAFCRGDRKEVSLEVCGVVLREKRRG